MPYKGDKSAARPPEGCPAEAGGLFGLESALGYHSGSYYHSGWSNQLYVRTMTLLNRSIVGYHLWTWFSEPCPLWYPFHASVLEHQVVGVPTGTASMPRAMSLSMFCFTLFFQWRGTGIGMWAAVGVTPWMKVMSNGFPAIACNGLCRHVLNAFDLKCSFIHFPVGARWFP